jgi:hypothetical protein
MAFVVILHLDPDRESRMGELLQDRASIPVTQVSGTTTIVGNHIYIIPRDHDLGDFYIVRINPYRSLDCGNEGVVITFFDNTAQHRIREELREAKIAAESANLAKSTFLRRCPTSFALH